MITIRCTYADDSVIVTNFNGTPAEATSYHLGQVLNIGAGPQDNMQRCTAVAVLHMCRYCARLFDPAANPDMCRESPDSVLYHAAYPPRTGTPHAGVDGVPA